MSITKNMPLDWYSSMKKKLRKIRIIFDVENWLWKSEIVIFRLLDLELWKSAIFHSINLPFDEQAAEKILNVIYYACTEAFMTDIFRSDLFSKHFILQKCPLFLLELTQGGPSLYYVRVFLAFSRPPTYPKE